MRIGAAAQPRAVAALHEAVEGDDGERCAALVRSIMTRHTGAIDEADVSAIEALVRAQQPPVADLALPSSGSAQLCIWQGDITRLRIGAIVNAANEAMLGCFTPFHKCIDNVIHWAAGPRLRLACEDMMRDQPPEPYGTCRVTPAFLLPSAWVCHTVGPDLRQFDGVEQPELLAACYSACLDAAKERNVRSIAFCGISTGVFLYPKRPAAIVATTAVREWLAEPANKAALDCVLFNTFDAESTEIYRELLGDEAPQLFEAEKSQPQE